MCGAHGTPALYGLLVRRASASGIPQAGPDQALTTPEAGMKVIIAEGECMLARQRKERPVKAARLAAGRRTLHARFGVDEDVCTGDHSCIRMSGCPSLTIKPSSDPLKLDPVATVDNNCLACGLCGENAQAAALCPSFYQAEAVRNPHVWERMMNGMRRAVIVTLQAAAGYSQASAGGARAA